MTMTAETRETSSSGSFFEGNRAYLADLFKVLEMPSSDDLEEAVAYTQLWVKGDHHTPVYNPVLSPEQEKEARLLFGEMGLSGEQAPPAGEYEQVVILGGTMSVNNDRTRYAAEQLARPDITLADNGKVMFWGGPRAPLSRELPAITSSVATANSAALDDPWLLKLEPGKEELIDETGQGRLSLLTYFGSLALRHINLRIEHGEPVRDYCFDAEEFGVEAMKVVLMNGRTVSREHLGGQPRHTTGSCTAQWLEGEHAPASDNPQVMFVTNNPHTRRTTASTRGIMNQLGADHINLVGCGPAAYEDAKTSLYLGEIGRLLYMDLMGQQASF